MLSDSLYVQAYSLTCVFMLICFFFSCMCFCDVFLINLLSDLYRSAESMTRPMYAPSFVTVLAAAHFVTAKPQNGTLIFIMHVQSLMLHKPYQLYTVNHKKRGTLFLTITTTFLGQFLHFLQQMKQE